jgi:hypothetical protein
MATSRRTRPKNEPGCPGGPSTDRGDRVGPSPVDRARPGSKHHLICDAGGIPLAVTLTGGNRNDITRLIPLLDAVPPIRGRRGWPRCKPRELVADRGYDHDIYRRRLRARGITPRIARRGIAHRWVVERGFAWLHAFKPAAHALRTPRRHPPRPTPAGLRADLLPPPAASILTPLLTPPGQQARRVTELTAPPGRPAGTPWGTATATSCRRSGKQRQRGCSFGSSKAIGRQPNVLGCLALSHVDNSCVGTSHCHILIVHVWVRRRTHNPW